MKSLYYFSLHFLHPCTRMNFRQVCLGVGEKLASVLKMLVLSLLVRFQIPSDARRAAFVE